MHRLETARVSRSQAEAATNAASEAQAEVQICQANLDQLGARVGDLDRQLGELDANTERQRGAQAGRREHHEELDTELAQLVARWTDALAGSVAGSAAASVREQIPAIGPRAPRVGERHCAWIVELTSAWRARCARIATAEAGLLAITTTMDREIRELDRELAEHRARTEHARARLGELDTAYEASAAAFELACAGAEFRSEQLDQLFATDAARLDILVETLAELDRASDRARAVVVERRRLVDEHGAARPEAIEDGERVDILGAEVAAADQQVSRLTFALASDAEARARQNLALDQLERDEAAARIVRVLGEVIGSHDGKRFRSFAQSLTLDHLLAVANSHLDELAPRYQLERVPRHDLELQIIDRDLGGDIRSVQSLSGGESFLVSLALALGLSSMSAHDVRVRTLLIDEGFGTLDPSSLDSALAVLDALKAGGRQVGVISHVPQLVERMGAHVRVIARGGGRSDIVVA